MEFLNRLDLSDKWVRRGSADSPGGQSHSSRGDGDPGPIYTPLSGADDQDAKRDYPVPIGLAAGYFNGEFQAIGEWATGFENGGTETELIKGMDFQGPAIGGEQSAAGFGSAVAGTNPLAHVKQNADVMHEQSVPFLLPNQMGYADSPFFRNEFPVNPSPDYQSGSPESSKSSDSSSHDSGQRYPDSDRETEEIFIEQPREHGYDTIDDGPESAGYPFERRSETEAFLEQREDETPAEDQFRHRAEGFEDAVEDFFEGEQSLRPNLHSDHEPNHVFVASFTWDV